MNNNHENCKINLIPPPYRLLSGYTTDHCSHNATLVEGLKNMTHKEVVAMIPVDISDPNIKKENGWKMPASNLYTELKKKSQNRVIRMDAGVMPSPAWGKCLLNPILQISISSTR